MTDSRNTTSTLLYATANYIHSGKLSAGYSLQTLTSVLEQLPKEQFDEMRTALSNPSPSSLPNLSPHQLAQQLIILSCISALAAYYETNHLLYSVSAGLVTASIGWLFLSKRMAANQRKLKEAQEDRITHLFRHIQLNPSLNTNVPLEQLHYDALRAVIGNTHLPAAFIDLQAFDRNVKQIAKLVEDKNVKVRIATKSLRIPDLIERALKKGGAKFCGLMCFSVEEAYYLYTKKQFDDLLIAYPSVQPSDMILLRELHDLGAKVSLVVDSSAHMQAINKAMMGATKPFPVVIEMDMSLHLSDAIHLGVRRSPVRTLNDLRKLLKASCDYPFIKVIGVMGYEAAVAGLADNSPNKFFVMNIIYKQVRRASLAHAKQIRSGIASVFQEAGLTLEICNGGGTGSANFSVQDPSLTEITAGSAFFCPQFVSHFSNIEFDPALFVALQVVRSSDPTYITCGLGGNVVASGPPGKDRNLQLLAPRGLSTLKDENFGEVQTPFKVNGKVMPELGWPVFFRPTKAGEAMEHFKQVELVEDGKIVGKAKTYRGSGL